MHLNEIHSSADVRRVPEKELDVLAAEMRQRIIDVVSQNGGHLASNLGVVELTIALHRAFDLPKDQIVFDVGHQCYAHKLLSGRQNEFSTLRRFEGMAGFPRREESDCDAFDTGHASTAISAAVGLARARDLEGKHNQVVAVVGDGALTGGMCYEALNDAGSSKLRLIVVLNDNGMSISPNVGSVSRYLTRMRAGKGWFEAKRAISGFMQKIPGIGMPLYRLSRRIKRHIRNVFVPDRLFDAFGFQYLGPVDGSDIQELERLFERAKQLDEPVLIHVVTQKGRGYAKAEDHPTRLHGTPPFDVDTGEPLEKGGPSMGAAAAEELCRMAEKDPNIAVITAAMMTGTGMTAFARKFPDRLYDVGIAEEHAVTMAAGLAAGGAKPFVAIYDTFMQRAYDHFIDACNINQSKFSASSFDDTWGAWRGDWIYIIPAALEHIAKQYNFSVKQFIAWCKEAGLLDCDKDNRNMKRVSFGDYSKRIRCYVIRSSTDGIAPTQTSDIDDDEEYEYEEDLDYDEPLPFDMP